MNTEVISYLLSKVCIGMAIAMIAPLLMSVFYGESCFEDYILAIGLTLIISSVFNWYGRNADCKNISVREGIGTVFFSWLIAAGIAAFPFTMMGLLDPASAYFETMSGLTTTGATAMRDLEILPKSILFWRSVTHWIGGIGIIVLFVALLPQIAGSAVYLFNAEVTGFSTSRILPRIRNTAVALFYIYLLITIFLTGILVALGMSNYDAVNHAFSTIATGGFSTYNSSVAHFNSAAIEYTIAIFMILAGGNFALYYHITQNGFKVLWHDLEFKIYIGIFIILTALITANIVYYNGFSVLDGIRVAFFQVASFGSTTGYVSCDYDKWPAFSKLLLAVMYFTGGCAGSTAGGIKVCRFIVLLKTVAAELRRTLHPQMLLNVYYGERRLPMPTVINISRFFFMYIMIIAVISLIVSSTGLGVEESIFGVAACLSSVGPGFDSIGATGNYAHVTPIGKLALSLAMLLGRLELFTALALLRSDYWKTSKRW